MSIPIAIIDAFASGPFKGNPAAVCLLEHEPNELWMQQVAEEMNLSETAFLLAREDGSYYLRWFTPTTEVDLCGHATLASAHFLWTNGHIHETERIEFHTHSGLLTAKRAESGAITLNFPAEPVEQTAAPDELLHGLGLIPRFVGRNRMDFLVEVDSERTVRTLKPDFSLLAQVPSRGIIVTSRCATGSNTAIDFVSRAFFPASGVNEDPVTGSAHCALAPYWQRRLRKNELLAYQASSRGGELILRVEGDRVFMTGNAVTVLIGNFVGK
ncbi:isomerase [Paenibacillus baekrokdamisoli]|uniref:Isomerase n=1 Tax=Paenibacillus baekrokdamisoli TaxID=1712516 RepID=A0A3G9J0E6_9BACL|nr:PhzF family phenazine biosynthesis protein [Paenibacillus baekrokdamisoli]MBB3067452.1 PhzF family phenazine biosynthesis protein [Paenibacillus baekrokdamisoli]BBH19361.1 isomerase [Paenibacillus baekrokdamisoli]